MKITKQDAITFSYLKWQKLAALVRKYRKAFFLSHYDKISFIKEELFAVYPFLRELASNCGLCERFFKDNKCDKCFFRTLNNGYSCNRLHEGFWNNLTEHSARKVLVTIREIAETQA